MAYPTEAQHQQNDAAAMKVEGHAARRWTIQIQANVDDFCQGKITHEAFSAKARALWDRIEAGSPALKLAVQFLLRQGGK